MTPYEHTGAASMTQQKNEKTHSAELAAVVNDTGSSPTETASNGVDLRVIREAYAFDYHTDTGELWGLTAGDQGYEPTGIIIETLTPQWKAEHPNWIECHTPSKPLAGNQPTTKVSSPTAASPAQKTNSQSVSDELLEALKAVRGLVASSAKVSHFMDGLPEEITGKPNPRRNTATAEDTLLARVDAAIQKATGGRS